MDITIDKIDDQYSSMNEAECPKLVLWENPEEQVREGDWGDSGLEGHMPLHREAVQSLIRELRSGMPRGVAKKEKEEGYRFSLGCWICLWDTQTDDR